MRKFLTILLAIALQAAFWALPAAAQSGRSGWDEADTSRVRLLLLPPDEAGKSAGGVEIQLDPGWHTYWQVPGDAGVPPRFDFSGSQNVANVSVGYPVPERYAEGGSVSVIYKDRVVFPLAVEVEDPGEPVVLSVDVFYGACAEVCIPVKASVSASIGPGGEADPLARIAIDEFSGKLPGAPSPDFEIVSARSDGERLTVETVHPGPGPVDLFVKGPENWFTGQPEIVERSERGGTFSLSLKGVPDGADVDGKFDMLLVSGNAGVLTESVPVDRDN